MKPIMAMLTASPILFSGCRFVHDTHLDGPYYLVAVDVSRQMALCYDIGNGDRVGRVQETVFAVGWNPEYVVAQRHPDGDKSMTEYYYLSGSWIINTPIPVNAFWGRLPRQSSTPRRMN
ncbi:MAG: hypothetical protein U1E27_10705 [Kiritimatiellia bacterium]|nr:hypothetical protein [Kiritimatiellia bacterium]